MGIPLANPLGDWRLLAVEAYRQHQGPGGRGGRRACHQSLCSKSRFSLRKTISTANWPRTTMPIPRPSRSSRSLRHGGPKEHVFWVREARKAVKLPLFASLNCINSSSWVEYASQLADTGVSASNSTSTRPRSARREVGDIEKQEATWWPRCEPRSKSHRGQAASLLHQLHERHRRL